MNAFKCAAVLEQIDRANSTQIYLRVRFNGQRVLCEKLANHFWQFRSNFTRSIVYVCIQVTGLHHGKSILE